MVVLKGEICTTSAPRGWVPFQGIILGHHAQFWGIILPGLRFHSLKQWASAIPCLGAWLSLKSGVCVSVCWVGICDHNSPSKAFHIKSFLRWFSGSLGRQAPFSQENSWCTWTEIFHQCTKGTISYPPHPTPPTTTKQATSTHNLTCTGFLSLSDWVYPTM